MPFRSIALSMLFHSLIIFALLRVAVAASLPLAGGHDAEELPRGVKVTWTEFGPALILPDDFDVSHPAFNTTALLELKEANKPIPQIPGIPSLSKIKANGPAGAIEKGVLTCETSSGSPNTIDVYRLVEIFDGFPDIQMCCNSAPGQCTRMTVVGTAATSICNWKGHNSCIPCATASTALYLIANRCNSAQGKAGGYVRSLTPSHPIAVAQGFTDDGG